MTLREFAKLAIESIPQFMHEGKSNEKGAPQQYDAKQMTMGARVEREHTKCPVIAKKIARDHLAEFPNYYTALAQMEKKLKS